MVEISKKQRLTNAENMQKFVTSMPPEKRNLLTAFLTFMMISLLFYQQFLWWSGDRVAIPIPGMMSIMPAYNIDAVYNENFEEGDSLFIELKLCSSIEPICVPCDDCSADLYYDFGNGKQLHEKNLDLINGTTTIQIRTIPTWLYIGFNNTYFNFIRIPDPSLLDYIIESSNGSTNKLTFFVTWGWLLTALWTVFSVIRHLKKFMKKKKKKMKILNSYRKLHRKVKRYYSSYFSVILPALIIGIFFALALNQEGLPKWEPNPIKWAVWIVLGLLALKFMYHFGRSVCPDEKEKTNFHNNYFITIFTTIPLFLLILYNDLIKRDWRTLLLTGVIFILYYIITNHLYLKISKS